MTAAIHTAHDVAEDGLARHSAERRGSRRSSGSRSDEELAIPAPTGTAPGDQRPTVLIVDDEAEIRAVMAEAVELLGYRPVVADSGDQALALVDISAASVSSPAVP